MIIISGSMGAGRHGAGAIAESFHVETVTTRQGSYLGMV